MIMIKREGKKEESKMKKYMERSKGIGKEINVPDSYCI
jgi:hypothetical protein